VLSFSASLAWAQATPALPARPAEPPGARKAGEPPKANEPAKPADAKKPPAPLELPDVYATDTKAAKATPAEPPGVRAKRSVVVIQRGGKALAMGVVLAGDGRILTVLSPLGHGNNLDVRFSDGKVVPLKVASSDRAWDLALVEPTTRSPVPGLRASRAALTPESKLEGYTPGVKDVATVSVKMKGATDLTGADGATLAGAVELASKHKSSELGSPVIDERGDVVLVISQACAPLPDKPCSLVPVGVPVSAIKGFLRAAPGSAATPPFGVSAVAQDAGVVKGVRVLGVSAGSRAAALGLRPSADLIVAVDGRPVSTPEALAEVLESSGRSATLLVYGGGRFREVRLNPRRLRAPATRQGPRARWPRPRRAPGY